MIIIIIIISFYPNYDFLIFIPLQPDVVDLRIRISIDQVF